MAVGWRWKFGIRDSWIRILYGFGFVVALFYDSGFEDEEPTRTGGDFEGLSLSVNIPGLDRE